MDLADLTRHWQMLFKAQNWTGLLKASSAGDSYANDVLLPAALWHARALRALERGDEANKALVDVSKKEFKATANQVAEFAEELVQCAYYEAAATLAIKLEAAKAPHGDYIWAMLWREKDDWTKCLEAISRLSKHRDPWPALATIQKAWALIRQGHLAPAVKLLEPMSGNPHPGLQKLLARLDLARGSHEAARIRLEKVAQGQPLDWEWPTLLAVALSPKLVREDPNRLFELYAQGLKRQPRQPDALVNRAKLRLHMGDRDGAILDTDQALKIKPWFDAPVLFWVEQAIGKRDYETAKSVLITARKVADTPKRASAAVDLLRLNMTKFSDVIRAADELVRKYPKESTALRSAGAAYQSAKQLDKAVQCYQRALARFPDDMKTRNNLALLYRDRGDFELAISAWRENLTDADSSIRLNYAHTLLRRGDRKEAREIFEAVLSSVPQNSVALRGMAEIAYESGADEEAWDYAQRSINADPKHPLAWKTASHIAARRQNRGAAIEILLKGEENANPVLPVRQALFQRLRRVLSNVELKHKVSDWCEEYPDTTEYWLMAADVAHDGNRFNDSETALKEAYKRNANEGGPPLVRFYLGRDREGAARKVAEQLTRDEPATMRNWGLLAEVLYRQERFTAALSALDSGLKREPTRLSLVQQKVGILLALERFEEAIETAEALFVTEPRPPQLQLLTEALIRSSRTHEAVTVVRRRLDDAPKNRVLRLMFADLLQKDGRHSEALETLKQLYLDEPSNYKVVRRYVQSLASADLLDEAVQVLRGFIELSGEQPDLIAAVAELMLDQGLLPDARILLTDALKNYPSSIGLWRQLAATERRAGDDLRETATWRQIFDRFPADKWIRTSIPSLVRLGLIEPMQQALNSWRDREPDNADPWWAGVVAAREMKRYKLALELLDKIEERRGRIADVHAERANLLQELWRISESLEEIRQAIELRPDSVSYRESLFNILVKAGDFAEVEDLMARLEHLLGDRRYGRYRNFFFNLNCHPTWTAQQVSRFYNDWYERHVRPGLPQTKSHPNSKDPGRRLRVGYVSPDFRQHAVAYFSEPLLVKHDRQQFELFAYAHLDSDQADEYTDRYRTYFDHWTNVRGMSDDELERRIRADEIDILVDLAGHTANNRLPVFMRRPAPVQASWIWGAGQTTGLPQVDYFLTDSASVPSEFDDCFAERVMRLPQNGLPFKPASDALDPEPLPCLQNGFVTFGVLARPLRTNRETVAVWAEILKCLPTAVLRFDHVPYAEPDIQTRLSQQFLEFGVESSQLDFRNTRPHWKAYQEIDIQLDPFPAGSATTATEGLFMDRLPITLKSRPPMGRIPHGQVTALGLEDVCAADNETEYIEQAIALAENHEKLAHLSSDLRSKMEKSWLMDYENYGVEVAKLYRSMWINWCETPDGDGETR